MSNNNAVDIFTSDELKIIGEWKLLLADLTNFVKVDEVNGIKFIIHTNENAGHHIQHLHVETATARLSIAIEDGEIIEQSGKINPGQIKRAKKWISENNDLLIKYWNDFSNGIKFDVVS